MTAAGRTAYAGRRVLVAGAGVAGAASARELLAAGAIVTVLDRCDSAALTELAEAGASVAVRDQGESDCLAGLLDGVTDAVVSPGFPRTIRLPRLWSAPGSMCIASRNSPGG